MLESIIMVTMLVTNLSTTEQAYDDYLGYDTVVKGNVNENLASIWDAENMINHPYIIMQPESGEDVYLRFIEDKEQTNYKPVGTHGWNSTEILVEDPDKLADELENSPFEIIGMPYDLYPMDLDSILVLQNLMLIEFLLWLSVDRLWKIYRIIIEIPLICL